VIDVGQVIDKYELLERVGQGGMAIVYRGIDRSLKREVAVKVLHRHLSDHAEARDRFEREAHAVAKLRHENILEIFDYSGKGSDESYIVTEFIEGMTLKQFVTDHPPQYPEIGAMIVTQVCRALAHAHAQGILHRDVKPENVMIRTDGVVKLMDFGISQMIDTQRLTVTGQLLGSPAYMSPEHVEGRPLDVRTDVFAAGIVLYQLTTGRLPFEGKNPHEILKRIAECKFADPRHISPRIGNELGRITLRAMARDPEARFRDMAEMLAALERFLDGSGLGSVRDELARYFKSPASYEMALKARLTDHLVRRARDCLASQNQPQALELLDRVLAIDPVNPAVTEIMGRLGKRQRARTALLVALAVFAVGGVGWSLRRLISSDDSAAAPDPGRHARVLRPDAGAPRPDAARAIVTPPDAEPAAEPPVDAAPPTPRPDARGATQNGGPDRPLRKVDAGVDDEPPDAGPPPKMIKVTIRPEGSEVKVGDGDWQKLDVVDVPANSTVEVRNPCCEPEQRTIYASDAPRTAIELGFLAGKVTPTCATAGVTVTIDGQTRRLGKAATIPFGVTTVTQKTVKVEFVTAEKIDTHRVTVKYAEAIEVKCRL
jgi:serine/threonine-protein kinase